MNSAEEVRETVSFCWFHSLSSFLPEACPARACSCMGVVWAHNQLTQAPGTSSSELKPRHLVVASSAAVQRAGNTSVPCVHKLTASLSPRHKCALSYQHRSTPCRVCAHTHPLPPSHHNTMSPSSPRTPQHTPCATQAEQPRTFRLSELPRWGTSKHRWDGLDMSSSHWDAEHKPLSVCRPLSDLPPLPQPVVCVNDLQQRAASLPLLPAEQPTKAATDGDEHNSKAAASPGAAAAIVPVGCGEVRAAEDDNNNSGGSLDTNSLGGGNPSGAPAAAAAAAGGDGQQQEDQQLPSQPQVVPQVKQPLLQQVPPAGKTSATNMPQAAAAATASGPGRPWRLACCWHPHELRCTSP